MTNPVRTRDRSIFRRLRFGTDGAEIPLWAKAILGTAILLGIGGGVAPGSVSGSAFLSMLPFVAILGIASIGQHMVVQQRGLDLSAAGVISFTAVLVTALPTREAGAGVTVLWIFIALAMGSCAGALIGLIVSRLRVPSLVTSIGVNALVIGATLIISGGRPAGAPEPLSAFALSRTIGIPNTLLVMIGITLAVTFVMTRSGVGRRFLAMSVNPAAAYAIGVPVERYRVGTFAFAGLCYAIAGMMLAGFLSVPSIFLGDFYMLATVAAVVVGGNSIAGGGRSSVLATVIGAFFLTYLSQLVFSLGAERSMQNVVQAAIVVGGVALPELIRRARRR